MSIDIKNKRLEWMKVAFREAEKAFEAEEVPIGAIVVKLRPLRMPPLTRR